MDVHVKTLFYKCVTERKQNSIIIQFIVSYTVDSDTAAKFAADTIPVKRVQYIATNINGYNASFIPQIVLCDCKNLGYCLFTNLQVTFY